MGQTEDFEISVLLFQRWLNLPALQVPHARRNVRPNELKIDLLEDEELAAAARDANAEDLRLHRDITERIYPAQIKAYGPGLDDDLRQLQLDNQAYRDPGEPVLARLKRNWLYKPLLHLGLA